LEQKLLSVNIFAVAKIVVVLI